MSDYNYGGWGHYGFAANDNGTITASYTALTLGQVAGITRSQGVPDDAHLYDILFELSSMVTGAGAPGNISFYLARDNAGTKPLTPILTAPIVTSLGADVATGGAHANIEVDFHSTSGVGPTAYNTLYLIVRHDGSADDVTADVFLSWRS